MARATTPLTDRAIRASKPAEKPYRMFDGGGLYLEVMPNASRYWRLKYRHAGKEKRLALGVYPAVSLAEARIRREDAKRILVSGDDPGRVKRARRLHAIHSAATTFASVAAEWLEKQRTAFAPATYAKAKQLLELAGLDLGPLPMSNIEPRDVLGCLRKIEAQGKHETAHRVRQRIGQVFRYAIATGRAERDPAADLRGALAPVKATKRAAVTDPVAVGALLRAIDGYAGRAQPVTAAALRLAALVFVRPGELRAAEWQEIDLDACEWRIPAHRMKMREAHVVPLSRQAVDILRELHVLTGRGRLVFPGLRSVNRPLSENTLNAALRNLGYTREQMTAHGFRALASTRLNELGWPPEVIERQLAHAERNKVKAAYNRASYLEERRRMMQAWADYLDQLRSGGTVVPMRGVLGSATSPRA